MGGGGDTIGPVEDAEALEAVETWTFQVGQPIKHKNITTFVLSISSLLEESQ